MKVFQYIFFHYTQVNTSEFFIQLNEALVKIKDYFFNYTYFIFTQYINMILFSLSLIVRLF